MSVAYRVVLRAEGPRTVSAAGTGRPARRTDRAACASCTDSNRASALFWTHVEVRGVMLREPQRHRNSNVGGKL